MRIRTFITSEFGSPNRLFAHTVETDLFNTDSTDEELATAVKSVLLRTVEETDYVPLIQAARQEGSA